MVEPTPIRKKRRYTKATMAATVLVADQSSVNAAAEATGIPRTTIEYWMDKPEFVDIRQRAHEGWAEEVIVVARRGWGLIAEKLPEMEPKDLIDVTEMATAKALLMSGEATSRTETKTLTDGMDDHERETLRRILDEVNEPA